MLVPSILVVVVAAASPGADEHIAKGQAALADLEYDVAAAEFTSAASDPAADEGQRTRASMLAGIANRIAGRETEARLAFRYVLLRNVEAQLPPDSPPKVVEFFELVRHEIEAERAAAVTQPPPPTPAAPSVSGSASQSALSAASMLPVAVAAGGGVLALAGGAVAIASEGALDDATLDGPGKAAWLLAGRTALAVTAAGVVVGVAGAAWSLAE